MLASLVVVPAASAQTVSGRFYFLVENRDTHTVEQRGLTESAGVAFSNLTLRSNTNYTIYLLEASTLRVADVTLRTPGDGSRFTVPTFFLHPAPPHGAQDDLLHNLGEFIVGTDPNSADTDGDSIPDGAEILAGQDPLSGLAAPTGILNSLSLGANNVSDVDGRDEVLAVGLLGSKVVLINAFNGLQPRVIGEYRTVGAVLGVAYSAGLVGLADGPQGFRILDFTDPPNPVLRATVSSLMLQGEARCVAVTAGVAYVGLSTGRLVSVDMQGGQVLERLNLNDGAVVDLDFDGDVLVVLTATNTYHAVALGTGALQVLDSLQVDQFGPARRLTVGRGLAFGLTDRTSAVDTSSPTSLALLGLSTQPPGIDSHDTALNGSGLGLQVIRPTISTPTADRVSVFDLSDPANFLLTNEFFLPAAPTRVRVFNGLAYVGDVLGTLHVVNTFLPDTAGVAPTISLSTNFGLTEIEEGKLARVSANVTDDIQPRAVEFYRDGALVVTDNAFPFEFRFLAPTLSQQAQFTLRARVFDTGGNFTWTPELPVTVTPDATGPLVRTVVPAPGSALPQVTTVAAQLSEPVDPGTLSQATFRLVEAGPNQILGDMDDVAVTAGSLEARPEVPGVFRVFAGSLPAGIYRATLDSGLLDAGGNSIGSAQAWDFTVYGGSEADSDQDGIPDLLELALGFDPALADSDGDGVLDGDEDGPDLDGLTILQELLYGLDPFSVDTDMDGVPDPETDLDFDRAFLITEIQFGSSAFDHDTDDDGYDDKSEIDFQSSPTDPLSTPVRDLAVGVAIQNRARPSDAVVGVSVFNQAPPGAVDGEAIAKPTSVENQAP